MITTAPSIAVRPFIAVLTVVALLLAVGISGADAQVGDDRNVDAIVDDILENQGARRIGNVNPNEVDPALLEELGEAVMGRIVGYAGFSDLPEDHSWVGYRYILRGGNLRQLGRGRGMMGPGMMGFDRRSDRRPGTWGSYGMPQRWVPTWVWVVGIVLVLTVLALVMLLLRGGRDPGTGESNALAILRGRYARGEISREEFHQMKKDLS